MRGLRVGLEISDGNTKYIVTVGFRIKEDVDNLKIGNDKVERVEDFKYLGTIITR